MTCRLRWYGQVEIGTRIQIWRTFGRIQCHVIPQPRATLQGGRIPSAILKIVLRRILFLLPATSNQTSRAQQTSLYAPPSRTANLTPRPLSNTAKLAPRPTVRHNKPRPLPRCQAQKPRTVNHCQTQQTLPCAPLSGTTNLASCHTLKHSKLRPVPHCHAQQTSPHAPLSDTSNLVPTSHCQTQQISPHVTPDTANLAPRPNVTHSKSRPTPNYQTQQTSPCAALSVMMPEFIRRMRYSGTAWWQVCHASHYLVFLRQFGLPRAAAFVSSPIHLYWSASLCFVKKDLKQSFCYNCLPRCLLSVVNPVVAQMSV